MRTGASADREAWGFVLSGALFALGVLSWPTAVTLGALLVPLAMQVQLQLSGRRRYKIQGSSSLGPIRALGNGSCRLLWPSSRLWHGLSSGCRSNGIAG